MHVSDFLIPLASVLVGLFTLAGVIFVAIHRKDATTPELWTENGNLRDRMDRMDVTIQAQDAKIDKLQTDARAYRSLAERQTAVLGTAFDILFRLVGGNLDKLSIEEQSAVTQARGLRTGTGDINLPVVN